MLEYQIGTKSKARVRLLHCIPSAYFLHTFLRIYIFNASVQTVRYSKCLHFQPSKSSSSYPLDAYYRTHRERQKFKTNAFSFTCCSQQGVLFYFGPSSFFRCWSVRPPLTFSTTRKKNCRGREKQRDVAERKREIFFFSR